MDPSNIKTSTDLKTKPTDCQKTQDQLAMLRLLALGRKQIEDGKLIAHDDVVAIFDAEDYSR